MPFLLAPCPARDDETTASSGCVLGIQDSAPGGRGLPSSCTVSTGLPPPASSPPPCTLLVPLRLLFSPPSSQPLMLLQQPPPQLQPSQRLPVQFQKATKVFRGGRPSPFPVHILRPTPDGTHPNLLLSPALGFKVTPFSWPAEPVPHLLL